MGADPAAVQKTLLTFKGFGHRLEYVGAVKGIEFYDDSKATNVGAVVKALEGFIKPVILIAGGRDKGGDYYPLRELIQHKVKNLILIGEAREIMMKQLGGLTKTEYAGTLEEAVLRAFQQGRPGDVVLLSPACSSFDMFRDYVQRGDIFQKTVRELGGIGNIMASLFTERPMPDFQENFGGEGDRTDRKIDLVWLGVTMALVIFGIVMVYSASSQLAAKRYHNSFYFAQKQMAFAFFGFLVMIAFRFIPYQKFQKWGFWLMAGNFIKFNSGPDSRDRLPHGWGFPLVSIGRGIVSAGGIFQIGPGHFFSLVHDAEP